MGLPIVLGTKISVSSRPIATYIHHVENDDQGRTIRPLPVDGSDSPQLPAPLLAWTVTRDDEDNSSNNNGLPQWQALVSLYYFKLLQTSPSGKLETTVAAEFRIQVAPAAEAFSNTRHLEIVYNVFLPIGPQQAPQLKFPDQQNFQMTAHFTTDRKSLLCVCPLPSTSSGGSSSCPQQSSSTTTKTLTVLFPLRRRLIAAAAAPPKPPPLPSYLSHTISGTLSQTYEAASANFSSSFLDSDAVPLATEPKVIDNEQRRPFTEFTCLCNVSFAQGQTFFVFAGDAHGKVRAITIHPSAVSEPISLLEDETNKGDGGDDTILMTSATGGNTSSQSTTTAAESITKTNLGIKKLESVTEEHVDNCYRGHLAVVDDREHVHIWRWQVSKEPTAPTTTEKSASSNEKDDNDHDDGVIVLKEIPLVIGATGHGGGNMWFLSLTKMSWRLPEQECVSSIKWVTPWNLASVVSADHDSSPTTAAVKTRSMRVWGWAQDGHPILRSTLELQSGDLYEASTFVMPGKSGRDNGTTLVPTRLEYDVTTGCLVLSSSFCEAPYRQQGGGKKGEHDASIKKHKKKLIVRPFVVVWNWKQNVRGFTLQHSPHDSLGRSAPHCTVLSHLFMSKDGHGRQRLVHVLACPNPQKCNISKDIYEVGILSPPSRIFLYSKPTAPEMPLLLSSRSISFASASRLTVTGDYQMEWKDAMIPPDYCRRSSPSPLPLSSSLPTAQSSNHNTPRLACIAKRGLTVAVAGQYGFCVLECPKKPRKRPTKWHRFPNEQSEFSFSVISLSIWEGRDKAKEDYMGEDLIVAVVEVKSKSKQGSSSLYYLSCWSPHRLDANHQLFLPAVSSKGNNYDDTQWGVRLADDIVTVSLDILEEPSENLDNASASPIRKALILVSNDSQSKEFMVFQAQLLRRNQSNAFVAYSEKQPCTALIRCVGEYRLGSPADLFLAGGSYAFDLLAARRGSKQEDTSDYIATLGVIRRATSGFDAIAVSASTIRAIASLPLSDNVHSPAEISTYWLSDIAEKLSTFVWTLQLSNGNLICWSVPFAGTYMQHSLIVQSRRDTPGGVLSSHLGAHTLVHKNSLLLGSHCTAGSTETWMQVSSSTTKQELPLGPLPGSAFGCVLGSGQECRKLHRELGQDFEKNLFSADFLGYEIFGPSDFVLFPPAVVTALYMFLKNSTVSSFLQVQQHLRWRLESYPFRDSVMIALRLLALRSVEMYASSATGDGSDPILLEAVTNLVRNLTTPLKFAAFFLEVGRQLEPRCFDYMYPLPDPHVKDLSDLIATILDHGCLEISVASLPLLEDSKHSSSLCTFILNHCLKKLTVSPLSSSSASCAFPEEEARIVPDIFRYGLKLADPDDESEERIVDAETNEEVDIALPLANAKLREVQYHYYYDDDDARRQDKTSYFCALSKFFDPTPRFDEKAIVEAASTFIERGFDSELDDDVSLAKPEKKNGKANSRGNGVTPSSPLSPAPTAAGVVARHLLEPIFSKGSPDWAEVGRIAELVLGNKLSGLRSCGEDHLFNLIQGTTINTFQSWVSSGSSPAKEMDRFFYQNLPDCSKRLSREGAKAAFDLIMVLLAYEDVCEDMLEEFPGLLLVALLVGHTLGQVTDFMFERDGGNHFLIVHYLKAVRLLDAESVVTVMTGK